MQIVGEVRDRVCFIFDDMIDTGGTLIKAAQLLKDNGAELVFACATHGLFSNNAIERIEKAQALQGVYVTDSIPQSQHSGSKKLVVVSLVPLLSRAISRLHNEQSLSALFSNRE
jgi:ribose-phosphate pyrophosphokinase